MAVFICLILMLISYATACDRCVHQAKSAYFSSDAPLSYGACGYGSLAVNFSGGFLASGVSSLYKNGAGCGACFQIRCKDNALCTKAGTKVIMFDRNNDDNVDFVLSSQAFKAMALPGKDKDVLKLGIADIEYKRIPCYYRGKNLTVRVEERSRYPDYLAIKVLYQGGQTEIVAIDVAQASDTPNWIYMTRNFGAVWDTNTVPNGPLQFRFLVTSGYDGKDIWAKNVLPADWKRGITYSTQVLITDIAQESCSPCDSSHWK